MEHGEDAARAKRLERVSAELVRVGVDALFLTPSADLRYVAGYAGHASERPTLYILQPGETPRIVIPALEAPRLKGRDDLDLLPYGDGDDPYELVTRAMGAPAAPRTIAISDGAWAAVLLNLQRILPAISFVPASPLLRGVRMFKSAEELELLHEAGRRADEAFAGIVGERFSGRTEQDIAGELDRLLRSAGLERADWGPIVASGPNSASPHHLTGAREILPGDAVVLDFGGVLGGYQADITRTVHVGPPDGAFTDVYDLVARAQQAGVDASLAGRTAGDVDAAARSVIREAGFGEYFVHRTGHGLGLEAHEEPYLVAGNALALAPGMTFSVEPGVYLPGRFGVRIEDTVAVTENGPERFNHAPRDLQIVA